MNKQDISALAKKYRLSLKDNSIRLNESGLDFLVAYAEDIEGADWVLRIPRRDDVMGRTVNEGKVLKAIHQHVVFQVPVWVIYENDLIAYKKLEGVPMGTIDHEIQNYVWEVDIENIPEQYYESLAKVLADLHTVPKDEIEEAGVPVHTASEVRSWMRNRMEDVKSHFGVDEKLWGRWQNWLYNDELWPEETRLMHGDVHAGHIMIDDDSKVTGLIDWTEAKVTDISNDFVFQYKAFGEVSLERLLEYYRQAGGLYWPGMKEHIIELDAAYPVEIAEFAIVSGIEEYEKMAKDALGV